MDPIEVIADAIQQFEGWRPGTRSYKNRNPGNLEGGQTVDEKNYDVFPDYITGYTALLNELRGKFSGHNRHGIGPASTMQQLMNVYAPPSDNNPTTAYCLFICQWASKALGSTISPSTTLGEIWKDPNS